MNKDAIYDDLIKNFPPSLKRISEVNRPRIFWQVSIVEKNVKPGGRLVDLGAGAVPFMALCQKLGYQTTIVDDFGDDTYVEVASVLKQFRDMGVEVRNEDMFAPGFSLGAPRSVDLVTTHDSMEHWHNSPKGLFKHIWQTLTPGGVLWIGVPNAVNLRKRITVPFGVGSWSQMRDWYEQETFRGHVREPVVADLHYIAKDVGARRHEVIGRNWLGYRHPSSFVRAITPIIDAPMRVFPGLCSDIYLIAHKG